VSRGFGVPGIFEGEVPADWAPIPSAPGSAELEAPGGLERLFVSCGDKGGDAIAVAADLLAFDDEMLAAAFQGAEARDAVWRFQQGGLVAERAVAHESPFAVVHFRRVHVWSGHFLLARYSCAGPTPRPERLDTVRPIAFPTPTLADRWRAFRGATTGFRELADAAFAAETRGDRALAAELGRRLYALRPTQAIFALFAGQNLAACGQLEQSLPYLAVAIAADGPVGDAARQVEAMVHGGLESGTAQVRRRESWRPP
jgi:hypothetical protein